MAKKPDYTHLIKSTDISTLSAEITLVVSELGQSGTRMPPPVVGVSHFVALESSRKPSRGQ
jgi:hypothetical protein